VIRATRLFKVGRTSSPSFYGNGLEWKRTGSPFYKTASLNN